MILVAFLSVGVLSAIVIASLALLRPSSDSKALRRAFEALEEEFEDQRDHVRVALGRISRLKRTVLESGNPGTTEPAVESDTSPPGTQADSAAGQFRLNPRQQTIQEKILRQRRGGIQ